MKHFFKRRRHDPFAGRRTIEDSLPIETVKLLRDLKKRYGTEITLPAEPFEVHLSGRQYLTGIEGNPATSEEASSYIQLLAEEFELYPIHFVTDTRLKRIVLCGELFRSQSPVQVSRLFARRLQPDRKPLSFKHESCGGIPDGENGMLYFAITWERGDQEHVRNLIHHEFYHIVQLQQFGDSGDPEWSALNAPDFVYGPGGLAANYGSDQTFWVMPAEEWGHGFLNQYSMSAPEEDQAEIFAHLVTKPAHMNARLSGDDILRKKVERLKTTLRRFSPDMDEAFWQEVDESRLPFDL